MFLHATSVRHVGDYKLEVDFNDGTTKSVDLENELYGEVFEPLRRIEVFKQATVNKETNTVEWPNGADFAPEFLHGAGKGGKASGMSGPPKKDLPWKEAITRVLDDAATAMHYADVAEAIVEQGLRKKVGATPASTVAANLTTEIRQFGEHSAFVRVKTGEYMLRKHYSPEASADTEPQSAEETPGKEAGIIQAFGMYWRRNLIHWSNNPKLLGQQSRGAEIVDFSGQVGIYLLHDGRETIYVGRSIGRPLGKRLFEHTYDRLNGRWDRFSWFGLLSVTEGGELLTEPVSANQDILIATLEALLIEALEPPQNRKRGDEFRAVEYLQVEDPLLQKRQRAALLDNLKNLLD